MSRLVVCERHGLSYDADQQPSCPECRTTVGGMQPVVPRPSQLGAQPPVSARGSQLGGQRDASKSTGALRDGATTRRLEGRTTTKRGRRPSQMETQRPRLPALAKSASEPPNTRLHGLFALGWAALVLLLLYRHWWGKPATSAAPVAASSAEQGAEGGAEGSAATPEHEPRSRLEDPATATRQDARVLPIIEHRGRPGQVPDICRVAWLEMYDRSQRSGSQIRTPLMLAAESGPLEALEQQLSQGAEVDARDELNHTALIYAARSRRSGHVEALLRFGADGRTRGLRDAGGGSLSALDAALLAGSAETARSIQSGVLQTFLALRAPDLSALDEAGNTPLHWVAQYSGAGTAQLLLQRGADPEARNCPARHGDELGAHRDDLHSATPLLVAVWANNSAVARQLLESKANARALDERGRGAFHVLRHVAAVSLTPQLLSAGADPLLPDRDGKTALEVVAASGLRAELLRALTAAGRPIATSPASSEDLFGVLRRLEQEHGTEQKPEDPAPVIALLDGDPMLLGATDGDGNTALGEAVARGLARVAEVLVNRGARVDVRDRAGRSPMHRARDGESVRLLVRSGANLDARDAGGSTPLQLRAATPGSLDAVTALVEAGANRQLLDTSGRSALVRARASGSPDVAEYLANQL